MSEPILETAITKTTNLRYASIKSISIHWPERNYECINNTCQFQDILQVLSYPRAEEFTISRGPNAGWALNKKLREMLNEARSVPWIREQRSLVILHYAGDSIRTESFTSRDRTLFVDTQESRETYRDRGDTTDLEFNPEESLVSCAMFDEGYDPDNQLQENVDVLIIFDCPYHMTDIDFQSRKRLRTVEIVAAAESQPGGDPRPLIKHEDPFMHQVRYAASSALLSEIERRKKEGCRHVEIADVVESLKAKKVKSSRKRSKKVNIVHQRRLGMDPINLHVSSAAAEDSCRPS
ncbi:uncharacterized protein BDV14DRAFT_204799 [Aspergillus stella-maris]|uniref:uncharacterized protein n=1 Tax=Aspergillus stella-maris TaxID=1810926 RepID=UPI003CCDA3B4